jgi:hypothetical protein
VDLVKESFFRRKHAGCGVKYCFVLCIAKYTAIWGVMHELGGITGFVEKKNGTLKGENEIIMMRTWNSGGTKYMGKSTISKTNSNMQLFR